MLFWCLILEFVSLSAYKAKTMTVKAVKASINVSNVSYMSCALLCMLIKKLFTQNIYVYFCKRFFPGIPNLGTQIRCAQNRYTAFQSDLKYPIRAAKWEHMGTS